MLNADKALQIILKTAKPLSRERVKLRNALGRTLAEDVVANENVPSFNNSAMDGFALRSSDISRASKNTPITLALVGESSAGSVFQPKLGKGAAVRIMTGAKIPDGADAIVPVELANVLDDTHVQFLSATKKGSHVRRAGEEIKSKEVVLKKGELLSPARLGVLASLGRSKVRVTRQPRVNILATGSELVKVGKRIAEGQIRNSSSYALAGFVEEAGGEAAMLGIVKDKKKRIRNAIKKGLTCDILLITGGVSVGKYDLVKDILSHVGVEIKFWRVNIKPGKPLLFGRFKNTLVFGLPGNPVSTGVTFLQFVRPAINKMLGRPLQRPMRLLAVLDEAIKKKDRRRHFVRGLATSRNGMIHVRTTGTQSSAVLSSIAKANCLILLPEAVSSMKRGRKVEIELLTLV
jgi:molybdopterin molybdotransferase